MTEWLFTGYVTLPDDITRDHARVMIHNALADSGEFAVVDGVLVTKRPKRPPERENPEFQGD